MTPTIAFVGAGPTTLYTLSALLKRTGCSVAVTIFEQQATAGTGMPYSPDWSDPTMLANIASVEIPPLSESLLDWLLRQPPESLQSMGVTDRDLDDRTFVPRLALGRYFNDQFDRLAALGKSRGIAIETRTLTRVVDVAYRPDGVAVTAVSATGAVYQEWFDHAVLATGHQWPSAQQKGPGYYTRPWPATSLASVPPVSVGIRGASLTAIDTAVSLACLHGQFAHGGHRLHYYPAPGSESLRLTMLSRKGMLPEADFHFPIPFTPLSICTGQAVDELIQAGPDSLLEDVFDLFRRELLLVDPDYAERIGLKQATIEEFSRRYFARRTAADPFQWAEANLAEARRHSAMRMTVPWRYAILRMHEVVARIVPHLDEPQSTRFNLNLKPVFTDNYGAVPHQSVERLLALRRAGVLDIKALGDDHDVDVCPAAGGAVVRVGAERQHYPVFIEATGQKPLPAIQFPFLSLLEQGVVRDADGVAGISQPGIAIDEYYRPICRPLPAAQLYCPSLPYIMGRRPFVQGITSSKDMGETVGQALSAALAA